MKDSSIIKTLKVIGIIIGIIAGLLAYENHIERNIRQIVNEDEYISKIARQVRPSIIFNSKGSILNDMGGMQYIDNISVEQSDSTRPPKIVFTPQEFMVTAPILESMTPRYYNISAERGNGIDWVYTMDLTVEGKTPYVIPTEKFRLEILR